MKIHLRIITLLRDIIIFLLIACADMGLPALPGGGIFKQVSIKAALGIFT